MDYLITIFITEDEREYLFFYKASEVIKEIVKLNKEGKKYVIHECNCIADES